MLASPAGALAGPDAHAGIVNAGAATVRAAMRRVVRCPGRWAGAGGILVTPLHGLWGGNAEARFSLGGVPGLRAASGHMRGWARVRAQGARAAGVAVFAPWSVSGASSRHRSPGSVLMTHHGPGPVRPGR